MAGRRTSARYAVRLGDQCRTDRRRPIFTVIVAASLSADPHGPVALAQNCVVRVSTGLVIDGPNPTGTVVLADAPSNQVTEALGSLMPTTNVTVVPAVAS